MTKINSQEQNYKKPHPIKVAAGCLAGYTVQNLTTLCAQSITPKLMDRMKGLSDGLSKDEFESIEKATINTVKNSGLQAKGVEIVKATAQNADEISQIMAKEADKGIVKHFPKALKDIIQKASSSQIISGNNACWAPESKKIVVPENKLGLAVFHEAGHAANATLSKAGKMLQNCRSLNILALPVIAIALFKTKKAEGEQPKNKTDKATTFVKNNAGKLTFAAFIPMLLEEGLASVKGNKFAKQSLNSNLAKKVAKTNALGFSTYLLTAALYSLGVFLGVKVKDKIAHKEVVGENN